MPAPCGLVVKKGSNTLSRVVGRYAGAGIADDDMDVGPGRQLRAAQTLGHLECHILGADFQPATTGHRIAGIHREIDDHLLKLVLIDLDQAEIPAVRDLEFDVFADEAAEQVA